MTIEGLQKHWEVIKAWHENPKREVQQRHPSITDNDWKTKDNHDFCSDWQYRLKPQIEAWAVVDKDGIHDSTWLIESGASIRAIHCGGTVIRLVPEQKQ